MGKKVKSVGIRLSVTVLLGIAGAKRSEFHAIETGRVLSAMDPDYVGALSLMIEPGLSSTPNIKRAVLPCPNLLPYYLGTGKP